VSVSRVFFAIAHTNAWRNGAGREREGGKLGKVKERRGGKGKGKRWEKWKKRMDGIHLLTLSNVSAQMQLCGVFSKVSTVTID